MASKSHSERLPTDGQHEQAYEDPGQSDLQGGCCVVCARVGCLADSQTNQTLNCWCATQGASTWQNEVLVYHVALLSVF